MEIKKLKDWSLSGITRNNAVFLSGLWSMPSPRLGMSISSASNKRFSAAVSHKRSIAFTIMIIERTVSAAPSFNFR